MSHYDYEMSLKISAQNPPFYALLMACFRQAGIGTDNSRKLRHAFPATWAEYNERYHSPGGLIGDEKFVHPLSKYFGPEDGYWKEEQDETPSD